MSCNSHCKTTPETMSVHKKNSQISFLKGNKLPDFSPSAPEEKHLSPINYVLDYFIEIEGRLSEDQVKEWMLRVSVAMFGALTLGLNIPHPIVILLAAHFEKMNREKIIHHSGTSYGTQPRLTSRGKFKAFTRFPTVHVYTRSFKQKLFDHSLLRGHNGASAFLSIECLITVSLFDLSLRDKALLRGFCQILSYDGSFSNIASDLLSHIAGTNPETVFGSILIGSKPSKISEEPPSYLPGRWGELKQKMLKVMGNKKTSMTNYFGGSASSTEIHKIKQSKIPIQKKNLEVVVNVVKD